MRRKDREVKDEEKMLEILKSCDCCRLGFMEEEGAYIVPLNFGCEKTKEGLVLYFHSAKAGKKMELLKSQDRVSFEMDTRHELTQGNTACEYSYLYQCIMGKGRIRILESYEEKVHGLQKVMEHYSSGDSWEFPEKMVSAVAVLKLEVTKWSCKEHV